MNGRALLNPAGLLALGLVVLSDMPVDVFPDLTAPTVVVLTEAYGMAPTAVIAPITVKTEAVKSTMVFPEMRAIWDREPATPATDERYRLAEKNGRQAAEAFSMTATNSDGYVDLDEFIAWWRPSWGEY